MRILGEYDYRNAKGILESSHAETIQEVYDLLGDSSFQLRLGAQTGKKQNLSAQIQAYFAEHGWQKEASVFTMPELRYDLVKNGVPIEIEIGHERLVYAVFLKFLVDYSQQRIQAGIMVVTHNPRDFGHKWHNSTDNTRRKIESISSTLLVPILVLGIAP